MLGSIAVDGVFMYAKLLGADLSADRGGCCGAWAWWWLWLW